MTSRLCAECGYDLRGITSGRCPECGFDLARQAAIIGEIPWAFRKPLGRARAFGRTVAKVVRGGPWVARVVDDPVSLRDARAFRRIVAAIVALPFVAALLAVWIGARSLAPLAYLPDPYVSFAGLPTLGGFVSAALPDRMLTAWLKWDVLYPLSAGWTRPGVGVVAIWLTALMGCGAHAYVFAPRACPEPRRSRVYAFSYYLCARLIVAACCLLGAVGCLVWQYVRAQTANVFAAAPIYVALTPATFAGALFTLLALASVVIWYVCLLRDLRRLTLCGVGHLLLAAVGVPAGWLASAAVGLLLFPWAIGYVWATVDALRIP